MLAPSFSFRVIKSTALKRLSCPVLRQSIYNVVEERMLFTCLLAICFCLGDLYLA